MTMNSHTVQRLEQAHPAMKAHFERLLQIGYDNGMNPQVSACWRSADTQDALYAQGRTRPGPIITMAKRFESAHCFCNKDSNGQFIPASKAIDIFFEENNQALFTPALYEQLWKLSEAELGPVLEWGYMWTTFKEMPHFQQKGYKWETAAAEMGINLTTLEPNK